MRLHFLKNRDRGPIAGPVDEPDSASVKEPANPMPPAPSTLISDALNALSKATNTALANVEDHARAQVERANAEVLEARAERDEALKTINELGLSEREWKAMAEKSELTIIHQADTITSLRAEVQQWKTQLARLEDTCKDWKEQYMRAEEERNKLLARLDELAWTTSDNGLPPRQAYSEVTDPFVAKRASTSTLPPLPFVAIHKRTASTGQTPSLNGKKIKSNATPAKRAAHETSTQPSKANGVTNGTAVSNKAAPRTPRTSTAPRATLEPPTSFVPRSQVIRHVRAVVPVKEEEYSDEEALQPQSYPSSTYHEEDDPTFAVPAKKTPRGAAPRKKLNVLDDEDDSDRTAPVSRTPRRVPVYEDDDVDELAMSAEDDEDDDEYRPAATGLGSAKPERRASTSARPTVKKRKLDGEAGTIGRSITAKTPRKQ